MSGTQRLVVALLAIVGLLAIAAGIVYLVEPARSLPSFFPGQISGSNVHRDKRGIAGVVVGVLLLAGAVYARRERPGAGGPPTGSGSPPVSGA